MGIEFGRPWWLLALPAAAGAVILIDIVCARGRKGLKRRVSLAARLLLTALLALALASPQAVLSGSRYATFALCDLSDSAAAQKETMEEALREGLANAAPSLETGVISFGESAMVDAPLAAGRTAITLGGAPGGGQTDTGKALALAAALLPDDVAGRIALLSDGLDNGDSLDAQLAALAARGIAVDVLALEGGITADAQVSRVAPPAQVYQGEQFSVTVTIDALGDMQGTLVLLSNREVAATRAVTLRKGENTFVFQDTANTSGVVTYEAQIVAAGDENPRNDRLGAYMDVRGVPRVLIIGKGEELAAMLRAAGMEADVLLPAQLPQTAEELRAYHAAALVNVSYDDLADGAVQALDDYVRGLGRGLAVFGGDSTFALGGWRGTPLEDMLPVSMDVSNRLTMPTLSLVLVIDKSGSMTDGRYGVTRLDTAKEAAMRACEVLTARDNVGVIAFDDTAKWAVPLQQVTDVAAIQEMIGTIVPGGGTAFYSALAQALSALSNTDTQLKHVIFLTDGQAGDSGYEGVVNAMASQGITLTTVAVGGGANTQLLQALAQLGGGRAYATSEFDDIPKIFTKETMLATQSYVQNRTFYPVITAGGTLTDYAAFPALDGYLTTTAKDLSTVALATDEGDPLLSWWQYGAGRVIAWTSDVQGAWTGDFLRWEQASAFFAGMIAHVLPAEKGEGEIAVSRENGGLSVRYTVEDAGGALDTSAVVLAPDGTRQQIALALTAPGVYEGVADAAQEGAYTISVTQTLEGELVRTLESGAAVRYSQEHDLRTSGGADTLARIAAATGGRVLTSAGELFTETGESARARRDLTNAMLLAALSLFVLDAGQRRIAWEGLLPKKAPEKTPASPKPERKPKKRPRARPAPKAPPSETADKLLAGRKKKVL